MQSFRSGPGPNAGILDAEFEAFQSGNSFDPLFAQIGQPYPLDATHFQQSHQPPNSGLADWASDFKALDLGEARASPIPSSQFNYHAPVQHHPSFGWNQEFSNQQTTQRENQSTHQLQTHFRPVDGSAYGYTSGLIPPLNNTLSTVAQQKQPERHVHDEFDESAFEKAFEDATANLIDMQQGSQLDQDLYRTEQAGQTLLSPEREAWFDQPKIGSDKILEEAQARESRNTQQDEADELARTAGQLLENVKSDQSEKFQESNFLSLIRQLRDKEARVEGNKIVDVSKISPA